MNKSVHDPLGSNAAQFPLSVATTDSSLATTCRLGVVVGPGPVVAIGVLTAMVGLAEPADEAELEVGLDEGTERLALCPELPAHAASMIARTARPPALNSLGALIMPSARSQIAFNSLGWEVALSESRSSAIRSF